MPVTVQFKSAVKHNGREYRQNARVALPEPTAARLVAMNVVELVRGSKVPEGFASMVDVFRSIEAKAKKARPPVSPAVREKAEAEKRAFFRRFPWLETATQS
jgi:hypothetical protein